MDQRYGPLLMNTQEQLRQAFEELEKGTFRAGGAGRAQRLQRHVASRTRRSARASSCMSNGFCRNSTGPSSALRRRTSSSA